MDAAGFGKAVLFAMGDGGAAAIVFAATRPERTRALILSDTFPFTAIMPTGWDDIDRDPAELRASAMSMYPEVDEKYWPSAELIARALEMMRAVRSAWGTGAALSIAVPSARASMRLRAMAERMCASPGMARASLEATFRIDVRAILPTITVPTLVIHARDDPVVAVQAARYLADHIPGARYLEVDGVDAAPLIEPDRILTEVEGFLTGSRAAPAPSRRALRTVLFTDMVASTKHAAASGDQRWRAVLHRFGEITAEHTQLFGGTVVNRRRPPVHLRRSDAGHPLRRGLARRRRDPGHPDPRRHPHRRVRTAGRRRRGDRGHVAARILGQAGPGEILVSRTVRDLVVGSGTGFKDRGGVELRGVPGTWQLLAVDRHGAPAGSPEAELASMPTPGPRTVMRRSDRAVAVMARRAPWLLRGMARLAPATGRR